MLTETFLWDDRPASSRSSCSLFSSEDTYRDTQLVTIEVSPNLVSIPPKGQQEFTLNFAPKNASKMVAYLTTQISNLHPSLVQPQIKISGNSSFPLYYFDLPPSDYLSSRRKGRSLCGDIADESTRIVEFDAVGLGISHVR